MVCIVLVDGASITDGLGFRKSVVVMSFHEEESGFVFLYRSFAIGLMSAAAEITCSRQPHSE